MEASIFSESESDVIESVGVSKETLRLGLKKDITFLQRHLNFKRESLDKINTFTQKVISNGRRNLGLRILPVPLKLASAD